MSSLIGSLLTKIIGSKSQKDLKDLYPIVDQIREVGQTLKSLSHDELRAETLKIQQDIQNHSEVFEKDIQEQQDYISEHPELTLTERREIFNTIEVLEKESDKALEDLLLQHLPQAFAILRETAQRFLDNDTIAVERTEFDEWLATHTDFVSLKEGQAIWKTEWQVAGHPTKWNMVHYDVQMLGGIVLHNGKISEMATGEGKTLVATLPAFLNGLAKKGVHIVTVNDYLAKRDCEWMRPLLGFHGLKVDCIDYYEPHIEQRRQAYLADITYGTNNEFGFDYLRDNMAHDTNQKVQRKYHYVMVDEVDSVLIDEARTPLIIAWPTEKDNSEALYSQLKPRVQMLLQKQQKVVTEHLASFKKLQSEDPEEAGKSLFKAFRGLPKFKLLIKILNDPESKQIFQKAENFYMEQNSKMMPEADKTLYFTIDEKNNTVELTDNGIQATTKQGEDKDFFVLPDIASVLDKIDKENKDETDLQKIRMDRINDYNLKAERVHALSQLLKAYTLFEKEVDYIIKDGQVKIVDEQTGRVMEGRRYSDGLHQALEAKEQVKVEQSTQTYASITLQNYFRMYHKLSGMTGTAETEVSELWEIYKLDVVVVPTHRPIVRDDREDLIYRTMREKYNAIIKEVKDIVAVGRPILIGTTSVESSELLSRYLQRSKIEHQVLNAKFHAREAEIIMNAGKPSTVTIATNMAGRGTDIKLHPESKAAGGLAIIGTERHESRRVDRQLRGRSGRQGDPGSSQFFVSLEDNLMRLFASGRISNIMGKLGLQEGEVIQHKIITRSIERAQKKVEENNFSIRKKLLEYDNIMNHQRTAIYDMRNHALYGYRLRADIMEMFYKSMESILEQMSTDYEGAELEYIKTFGEAPRVSQDELIKSKNLPALIHNEYKYILETYNNKKKQLQSTLIPYVELIKTQSLHTPLIVFDSGTLRVGVPIENAEDVDSCVQEIIDSMEKNVVLMVIDGSWKEHLREMDFLRQEVQNATIEQKDPLLVYKFESFEIYKVLIDQINASIIGFLCNSLLVKDFGKQSEFKKRKPDTNIQLYSSTPPAEPEKKPAPKPFTNRKINRNQLVKVRYKSGKEKTAKYKNVQKDIQSDQCVIID